MGAGSTYKGEVVGHRVRRRRIRTAKRMMRELRSKTKMRQGGYAPSHLVPSAFRRIKEKVGGS